MYSPEVSPSGRVRQSSNPEGEPVLLFRRPFSGNVGPHVTDVPVLLGRCPW